MDLKNNDINEQSDNPQQSDEVSSTDSSSQQEQQPKKRVRRPATPEQLANPFHGVKLKEILERLVEYYGWEYLGERVNIRCFKYDPTMKSSLGFLRRTQWAREHVEDVYLEMLDDQADDAKKANQSPTE